MTCFPLWDLDHISQNYSWPKHVFLDPMSYPQGQGHSAHIARILVLTITSYCQVESGYYVAQVSWLWPNAIKLIQKSWIWVNLGQGRNLLLPSWIWIIFLANVHYPSVCPDLDQGQCHIAHIACHAGSEWYFAQLLSMTWGCVMTLTLCHISKFKVTGHKPNQTRCPRYNHLLLCLIWIIFHTIFSQLLWLCPRSYFQGHSSHVAKRKTDGKIGPPASRYWKCACKIYLQYTIHGYIANWPLLSTLPYLYKFYDFRQ